MVQRCLARLNVPPPAGQHLAQECGASADGYLRRVICAGLWFVILALLDRLAGPARRTAQPARPLDLVGLAGGAAAVIP